MKTTSTFNFIPEYGPAGFALPRETDEDPSPLPATPRIDGPSAAAGLPTATGAGTVEFDSWLGVLQRARRTA